MKKIVLLLSCLILIFCFTACGFNNGEIKDEKNNSGDFTSTNKNDNVNNSFENELQLETNDKYANVEKNPIVTMEMENGDIIKIELYPKIAPTTVENFISLTEQGFYDGLTFHRVIPIFMAQGGDPNGNGTGGPGYTIKGEFVSNGFKNEISHEIGVISMARTNDVNGAGSQFFIVTDEMSYVSLDGYYAAFGKVIEGMDFVYDIVNSEVIRTEIDAEILQSVQEISEIIDAGKTLTDEQMATMSSYYRQVSEIDRPINPPVIKSMTVETFGVDYDEPEKIIEQ